MAEPSPTTQAVLNAAWQELDWVETRHLRWALIAALRTVAHRVDWESGDPKFLVLALAAELEHQ